MFRSHWLRLILPLLALTPVRGTAQTARVFEEVRTLPTYPFSEPDPVPMLARDARLYPYHAFGGYSTTAEPRDWKVVRLENDYIEVYVLPEVGGKVWGAVVKEMGHEFIYRNEVMKFRNIALRGPWTSGGIEFNFGVIGHTPATATPVDYVTRENPDGSVSVWVGGMDLPSRTHWRVEVRLPADRAYFETNVFWYNPTPLEQPYYNWMTAAAFAQDDLEVSIPAGSYLQHSGNERSWPVDEQGRYLPLYDNNRFDGSKSYHVVGELNDFFGGYYRDEEYGFGHWARYEDMPGQKLWLWALSRQGGIWEDLLTDADGQYIEFQAGRLFVQYQPGADVNPITQAGFDPMSASRWTETWFPLEGTGGLTDASRDGAMHVTLAGDQLTVGVNAFSDVTDTLTVWSGDRLVDSTPVRLGALEPFRTTVQVRAGVPYRVRLGALGLDYRSDPSDRVLTRSFGTDPVAFPTMPAVDRMVLQARELLKGREHAEAGALFRTALEEEPWNREALLGLGELAYRAGLYGEGWRHVDRVLQLDAYDAEANFLAGTLYRALGRAADAHEAFGWAARSMAYRSAAYAQLAGLTFRQSNDTEAERYARLAIDYDRYSVPAWRVLAVIGRLTRDEPLAREAESELLAFDPLHHFVRAEAFLQERTEAAAEALRGSLGGEYPHQTLLELAIGYEALGLREDASALLDAATVGVAGSGGRVRPVLLAWRGWLARDPAVLSTAEGDPAFDFPFRTETLQVLLWASENSDAWMWRYLVALNLWAVDRGDEAAFLMASLGPEPDYGPFYAARAHLLDQVRGVDGTADFRRAVVVDSESWPLRIELIRHLEEEGRWDEALAALASAREHFPDDFNLDLFLVRALLNVGRAAEATQILATVHVLPSENARESHRLYSQAHIMVAVDALDAGDPSEAKRHLTAALKWPESLGQGRPYEPEERLVRTFLARAEALLGNRDAERAAYGAVVDASSDRAGWGPFAEVGLAARSPSRLDLLAIPALRALGRGDELRNVQWASFDLGRVAARLARDRAELFDDVEGGLILRALRPSTP